MGMAFAQGWFDQEDEKEKEIRALAQRLLDRTEWDWMQANSTGGKAISMGWHPESGFIERNWDGYNEGMALYFLARFVGELQHVDRADSRVLGAVAGAFIAAGGASGAGGARAVH